MAIELRISQIRRDGGTQSRAALDAEQVEQYRRDMLNGDVFPAVDVTYDGDSYWLTNGFHRIEAAAQLGRESFMAEVNQGTQSDAQWASFAANGKNGLERSRDDLIRAIDGVLQHPKGAQMSDHAIALYLKTTQRALVADRRRMLIATGKIYQSETRIGADGREINTAKIGKTDPPHWSVRRANEFWGVAKKYGLHEMIPSVVINAIQPGATQLSELTMSYEAAVQRLNTLAIEHWQATFPVGSYISHRNAKRIGCVTGHRAECILIFDERFKHTDAWQLGSHLEATTAEANAKYVTPDEKPAAAKKDDQEVIAGPLKDLGKTYLPLLLAVRDQQVRDPFPLNVVKALMTKGLIAAKADIKESRVATDYELTQVAHDVFDKSTGSRNVPADFQPGDKVDYFHILTDREPWVTQSQIGTVKHPTHSMVMVTWGGSSTAVAATNLRKVVGSKAPLSPSADAPSYIVQNYPVIMRGMAQNEIVLVSSLKSRFGGKLIDVVDARNHTSSVEPELLLNPVGQKAQVEGRGAVGDITAVKAEAICINRPNPNGGSRMTHWVHWKLINLVKGDVQQQPIPSVLAVGSVVKTPTGHIGTVESLSGDRSMVKTINGTRLCKNKWLTIVPSEDAHGSDAPFAVGDHVLTNTGHTGQIVGVVGDQFEVSTEKFGVVKIRPQYLTRIDPPETITTIEDATDDDLAMQEQIAAIWFEVQGLQSSMLEFLRTYDDANVGQASITMKNVRHYIDLAYSAEVAKRADGTSVSAS